MKKIIIALIFIFGLNLGLNAQKQPRNLSAQKQEIQKIRDEINSYEKRISDRKKRETDALNVLGNLDREIDMTTSYLVDLRRDIRAYEREIGVQSNQIAKIENDISELQDLVSKRLVSYYKYGRIHQLELFLSTRSLSQLKTWLHYQKLIAENDVRNIRSLNDKKREVENRKSVLRSQVSEKQVRITENQREADRLQLSRQRRKQYLQEFKKDTDFLTAHVQELREAQNQIRRLIEKNEERRLTQNVRQKSETKTQKQPTTQKRRSTQRQTPILSSTNFSSIQGRMLWPASGQIVTHFGKHKHPTLKTITENLGVEIGSTFGAPVRVVNDGQVQTITWQRGRGNIVIVGHGDGYYTVYTHLAEIRVGVNDTVKGGQVIGTVGESGSVHGPVLHFQIWKNTSNLNPEQWLS